MYRFLQRHLNSAAVALAIALAAPAVKASAALTEAESLAVQKIFQDYFAPIVATHGAKLITELDYTFTTPGAMATRTMDHKKWFVKIFGGIPKFHSATADTYTLILCHELGHHLGGYPFYSHEAGSWLSSEGQADYWATQACTKALWRNDFEINAGFADLKDTGCETHSEDINEVNLCKRIYHAIDVNAELEGKMASGRAPSIKRRDNSVVKELFVSHPKAQCRVDSALMGLRCTREFNFSTIPGRKNPLGQNTISAEKEARASSCFASDGFSTGTRPLCWFKPAHLEKAPDPKPESVETHFMEEFVDMNDGLLPWIIN
jgi:hypothetical protein